VLDQTDVGSVVAPRPSSGRVLGRVRAALIVVEGLWTWYRRNWRATVVSSVVQPVLFLLALGFGLGSQVAPTEATGGLRYVVYLAPALLVATAVQIAAFESTYPILSAFKWQQTYLGIAASPITPAQILGGQLTWMTQRGLESGSLRVSPEHLGPVEVQISVQNGDASVWFGASHPDTRAALEQALPRLREMFANQGLTLTDSGVSRESPRQTRSPPPQSVSAVSAVGTSDVSVSAAVRLSLGLVDTYA